MRYVLVSIEAGVRVYSSTYQGFQVVLSLICLIARLVACLQLIHHHSIGLLFESVVALVTSTRVQCLSRQLGLISNEFPSCSSAYSSKTLALGWCCWLRMMAPQRQVSHLSRLSHVACMQKMLSSKASRKRLNFLSGYHTAHCLSWQEPRAGLFMGPAGRCHWRKGIKTAAALVTTSGKHGTGRSSR